MAHSDWPGWVTCLSLCRSPSQITHTERNRCRVGKDEGLDPADLVLWAGASEGFSLENEQLGLDLGFGVVVGGWEARGWRSREEGDPEAIWRRSPGCCWKVESRACRCQ